MSHLHELPGNSRAAQVLRGAFYATKKSSQYGGDCFE